ncbi:MAG: FAD-dependent oxidoreductase, partial [Desulfatiglandales bacterium]
GGNTAVDCARMAIRLGSEVTIIYRRTREEMPAQPWEVSEAEEEGVRIIYLAAPVQIIPSKDSVKGLLCTRMTLGEPEKDGRRRPLPVENSEFSLEADSIIPAINLSSDLGFLEGKLSATSKGTLDAEPQTLLSSDRGVFVAGDAFSGPSTVIEAIASGHQAANSIHWYLRGHEERMSKVIETIEVTEVPKAEMAEKYDIIPRHPIPTLPIKMRVAAFDEVELGFTEKMAVDEAKRCLRCDHNVYVHDDECILCGRCSEVCPSECIQMVTRDGKVSEDFRPWFEGTVKIKDDALCIRCNLCREYCPAESISFQKVTWTKKT